MGEGAASPPPHELGGLWECCKLPQWGLRQSPGRSWFLFILGLQKSPISVILHSCLLGMMVFVQVGLKNCSRGGGEQAALSPLAALHFNHWAYCYRCCMSSVFRIHRCAVHKCMNLIKMPFVGCLSQVSTRKHILDGGGMSRSSMGIGCHTGWQDGNAAFCQFTMDTCYRYIFVLVELVALNGL